MSSVRQPLGGRHFDVDGEIIPEVHRHVALMGAFAHVADGAFNLLRDRRAVDIIDPDSCAGRILCAYVKRQRA